MIKSSKFLAEIRKEMQIIRASLAFVNVILRLTFIGLYKKLIYMHYYLGMMSSASVVIIYDDTNSLLALNFLILKNADTQKTRVTNSQMDDITNNRILSLTQSVGLSHFYTAIVKFVDLKLLLIP